MKQKRQISEEKRRLMLLIRKLADLVEKSTETELVALEKGISELKIGRATNRLKVTEGKGRYRISDKKLESAAVKFRELGSRELGMEFLHSEFPTKATAVLFARCLDLPINRTDSLEMLYEKIVESEIGSKLRSEAVRGSDSDSLF